MIFVYIDLSPVIQKCKTIVKFFNSSSKASAMLKKQQVDMDLFDYKVINQVETRWNSMYHMLIRIKTILDPLLLTLSKIDNGPPMLTNQDVNVIDEIIAILKPFEKATDQVSGKTYITMSLVIPAVSCLISDLNAFKDTIREADIKLAFKDLLQSVVKRLFVYERTTPYSVATILDPRLKKYVFHSEENYKNGRRFLESEIQTSEEADGVFRNTNSIVAAEEPCSPAKEVGTGLSAFVARKVASCASNHETEDDNSANSVFNKYLKEPVLNFANCKNPLQYWATSSNKILKKLATKYLRAPASSVPSERLFSSSGYMINNRRMRLTATNVNMLNFVHSNYAYCNLDL